MQFTDLPLGSDGEQVEALDFILAGAYAEECPIPQDLTASCHQDLVGRDSLHWRRVEYTRNVGLFALKCDTAQLFLKVSIVPVRNHPFPIWTHRLALK